MININKSDFLDVMETEHVYFENERDMYDHGADEYRRLFNIPASVGVFILADDENDETRDWA